MDAVTLLRLAKDAGLSVEPAGEMLKVRGPKNAEPMVKLLAKHKAEVLAVLVKTSHDAELLSPTPWFARVLPSVDGEPNIQAPCESRRGRVQRLQGAVVLHFCVECGAWGAFGYGVNLRTDRPGRWYCATHRPQDVR